jgi:hypothetical protein
MMVDSKEQWRSTAVSMTTIAAVVPVAIAVAVFITVTIATTTAATVNHALSALLSGIVTPRNISTSYLIGAPTKFWCTHQFE